MDRTKKIISGLWTGMFCEDEWTLKCSNRTFDSPDLAYAKFKAEVNGEDMFEPATSKDFDLYKEELNDYLEKAIQLATKKFKRKKDKADRPYIEHLQAVADGVDGTEMKIVAWLHDIIEDTNTTSKVLLKIFPPFIVYHVNYMTKKGSYSTYIEGLKESPITTLVKLSDLRHNMQLDRLPEVTEEDKQRVEKYQKAYGILNDYATLRGWVHD